MTNTEQKPWAVSYPFLSPMRDRREPRRSWLIALRCRLRRSAIDRELAAGQDVESSECRQRRAAELTRESSRFALATAYERLLVCILSPQPYGLLPINWDGVRAARPRIEALAKRLREDPRVKAQGAARARLLLMERDSALYAKHDVAGLVHEVRSSLALL